MKTKPVKESHLSQVMGWVAVDLEFGFHKCVLFSRTLSGSSRGMLEELFSVELGIYYPIHWNCLSPLSPSFFLFLIFGLWNVWFSGIEKLPFAVCCPCIVHSPEALPCNDLFFFLWRLWCQCRLRMTGASWRTPWKSPKNSGWWSTTCIEMLSSR